LSLADKFCPIRDQHLAKRICGESSIGVRDVVEPSLPDAIPLRFGRNAAIDAAKTQFAQSWKLANDLSVTSSPMREEFLRG
jgi:hypothetical protein